MKKDRILITIIACFVSVMAKPQDYFHYAGFHSMVTINPAAAGAEGDGTLRMMYLMHYPGKNVNYHYLSVSYDAFIPLLHGGIAGYVSDNYMGGIINYLSGGFSYSYHLQAGRNLYIYGGLSASFRHRGINTSEIVLPDQIDPMRGPVLPSGEIISDRGRTIFDVGTGFMMIAGNFTSGISVNHLAKPYVEYRSTSEDQLPWHITLFTTTVLNLIRKSELILQPVLLFDMCGKDFAATAGAMTGSEKAALTTLISVLKNGDINLQTGFSFKISRGLFFYNYCFNLTSANVMVPLAVYHQAGLSFSLYNVDKRKVIKTIKFPNL